MSAASETANTPTGDAERLPSLLEVFRNPNFFRLWIGQVVAYLGDRILQIAIIWIVTSAAGVGRQEQSSRASLVTTFATIPYILLSPFIGSLIDRVDRRNLLVLMDLMRALVILVVAFFIDARAHPAVGYAVVFLIACSTSIFAPTKSAFMPEIVTREQLLRANSVTSTMGSLMTLIGTPIGAALIIWGDKINIPALPGYKVALFLNAFTYLFSMYMLLRIVRPPETQAAEQAREAKVHRTGNYFRNLLDGLRFLRHNRIPACAVILESTFYLIGGALFACINTIIYQRLSPEMAGSAGSADASAATKQMSWVLGSLGIGLFCGCVFAGKVAARIKLGFVVATCFWATAFFMVLLRIPMGLIGTCATVFLLTFSAGGVIVSNETALQRSVPDEMRGRVFALNSFLLNLLMIISIVAMTKALDTKLLTLESALTVIAAVTALAGVIAVMLFPRSIRIADLRVDRTAEAVL